MDDCVWLTYDECGKPLTGGNFTYQGKQFMLEQQVLDQWRSINFDRRVEFCKVLGQCRLEDDAYWLSGRIR